MIHKTNGHSLGLVDSHCHLALEHFDEDREDVVARARRQGIRLIVNPGIDLDHCRRAIALADRYPEVYLAVGFHPNSCNGYERIHLSDLRELSAHPKVVAIGEIGLDYHWDTVDPVLQTLVFQDQLELAAELGLPVIIHNRDASGDIARTLEEWVQSGTFRDSPLADREYAGVLHAFSGDFELAQRAYGWNFILGLGGPVTFKNAHTLNAMMPQLRLDRLMLETDAPYLTPHPYRGQRNEPSYVALIAARIAELLDQPIETVAKVTTAVALRFYGLSSVPESSII